jgi:AcrR family transcriptional regulator
VTQEHKAPTRRGRGRRPADQVRADVLDAVGELLLTGGTANLTFDRVARLAGVSRTTLHNWWPSTGVLALDGYFHAVEDTLAFPDTGEIRADLITQLRAFTAVMTQTQGGRVLAQLIGQSQTDPDLAESYRALYSSERRRLAGERLERAKEVGQLRPDIDVQVLVDQLWGAIYHRFLIPDLPCTDEFVVALVTNLFDGIAPEENSRPASETWPRYETPDPGANLNAAY